MEDEFDDSNPDNLPLFLDHEENAVTKPNEALMQEESSESPEVSLSTQVFMYLNRNVFSVDEPFYLLGV